MNNGCLSESRMHAVWPSMPLRLDSAKQPRKSGVSAEARDGLFVRSQRHREDEEG